MDIQDEKGHCFVFRFSSKETLQIFSGKIVAGMSSAKMFFPTVLDFNATPPKTNMDPKNDGLEEEFPFNHGDFWCQAVSLRE